MTLKKLKLSHWVPICVLEHSVTVSGKIQPYLLSQNVFDTGTRLGRPVCDQSLSDLVGLCVTSLSQTW